MASTSNSGDGNGNQGNGGKGKYTRFSYQQIEIFEEVFAKCQNPTRSQRLQMVHDYPVLKDVNIKQMKVWFQNRRCREKQRKENVELEASNMKLIETNNIFTEENRHLRRRVRRLVRDNEHLRRQLKNIAFARIELNSEPAANSPQLSSINIMSLILLAEETMEEFLSKAAGAEIEWVPIHGIKPGSNSIGVAYISHNSVGVAAQACTFIPLGPIKIMEILNKRESWSRDCRNLEVFAKCSARNGGTIELIYMQFYAPTTLGSARDFWTLRYTSALEDGSLMVCEKSFSGSTFPINAPSCLEFVRAKMLPSGYLIRPCEGGGSFIQIVDHLDLEASSVLYALQPLYESSELLAQRTTLAALGHLKLIAKETIGELPHGYRHNPAVLRSFSQRLSRSFNDAVNTFTEDGWLLVDYDAEDMVISTKTTRNLGISSNYGGVLCVKTTMLLENLCPVMLVRLLRDCHSDWASAFLGLNSSHLSCNGVLFGHTVNEDEILEIFQVEHQPFCWKDYFRGSLYLAQICSGMGDDVLGASSELIFAPMLSNLHDEAMLLSSGFRFLSLGSKSVECNGMADWSKNKTAYMNGNAAANDSDMDSSLLSNSSTVLVTAFQFPFARKRQQAITKMALQHVHDVISSVLKLARAATPSQSKPEMGMNLVPYFNDAVHLAHVICESYRSYLGRELLGCNASSKDSLLERIWHHQDAILCWAFQGIQQSIPFCLFANQAGLQMLETTQADLSDISLDKMVDESGNPVLSYVVPVAVQQGYAFLPAGFCLSRMGKYISYEQAVVWRIPVQDSSMVRIAFAFSNWFFA